ncbi:hypothetical protein BGZ65_008878 [Modicella reniformis]|uniref:Uncharacterized protein n=1 Tax=Modicella reniformis TaxID=1440133 RepID=A0A9P6M7F7_9FUNG|nr:hypothetical protein BGZ65_008878 [Modicella reniformis]
MSTAAENTTTPQLPAIQSLQDKSGKAVDYHEELKTVQERLLEKSTKALIAAREASNAKKAQLESLDESDSNRSKVQSELDELLKVTGEKEYQWSATKEVFHREYAPVGEDYSAPVTEIKAKAEQDIKLLQEQIASLRKQLEDASIKRKRMTIDAKDQRLAEELGQLEVTDDDHKVEPAESS